MFFSAELCETLSQANVSKITITTLLLSLEYFGYYIAYFNVAVVSIPSVQRLTELIENNARLRI